MLTTKDKNVISELFNIGFSKSISRLSLLLDDRLDISVPSIESMNNAKLESIFENSNLIFNDLNGIVNIIKGEIYGNCAFLVEHKDNGFEIDIDAVNKVFVETVSGTLNSVLDANIKLVDSKSIKDYEDLIVILNKHKSNENNRNIIFSRWSTRNENLSGYVLFLVNIDELVKLPKFIDLLGLS